jgi:hypothetical protein
MDSLSRWLNMSKQKNFIKSFKKSTIDHENTTTSLSVEEQKAAEQTTDPRILKYLDDCCEGMKDSDVKRIPLVEKTLVIAKKGDNLYNAFLEDGSGQVIEKMYDKTRQMIGKILDVKDLVNLDNKPVEVKEEPKEVKPKITMPSYFKLKIGDFEFEMKKSLGQFVSEFKKAKQYKDKIPGGLADKKKPKDFDPNKLKEGQKVEREHTKNKDIAREIAMDHLVEDSEYYKKLKKLERSVQQNPNLYKALRMWENVLSQRAPVKNYFEAAEFLIKNWDQYKEDFFQTVHALNQLKDD